MRCLAFKRPQLNGEDVTWLLGFLFLLCLMRLFRRGGQTEILMGQVTTPVLALNAVHISLRYTVTDASALIVR